MPEVTYLSKLSVVCVVVVLVGVFLGMTTCAYMHPSRTHEPFTSPTCTSAAKGVTAPKCIRVVSTSPALPPAAPAAKPPPVPPPVSQTTTPSSRSASCAPPNRKTAACPKAVYCPPCPKCPAACPRMCPDMSKYVLKTSIPPCPEPKVDREVYMLKSECKQPDMSKYVLKSSLPSYKAPPCPPCVCKYEPDRGIASPSSSSPSTQSPVATANAPQLPQTTNVTTAAPAKGKDNDESPQAGVSKDLFGGDGLLGDSNMSAWNDTGATGGNGMGASLGESSTITESCSM